jgi:hypothetical protein
VAKAVMLTRCSSDRSTHCFISLSFGPSTSSVKAFNVFSGRPAPKEIEVLKMNDTRKKIAFSKIYIIDFMLNPAF